MRVVELVIDGFKSYAVRTVISGWDESFNSITGLNGSGKSNILDAICFVLGITSMSIVRAQNIQELIYKKGNAGITVSLGSVGSYSTYVLCYFSLRADAMLTPESISESQRDNCVRQSKQEEVAHRLRRVCADISHTANRYWRYKQIPHQWPPRAAADGAEPLSICSVEHQQPQFPYHARPHN